jgi:hypothetical protein
MFPDMFPQSYLAWAQGACSKIPGRGLLLDKVSIFKTLVERDAAFCYQFREAVAA